MDSFCPIDKQDWRKWLLENHETEDAVTLILFKKSAEDSNLSWSEAVDEALCFGWIDSVKKTVDENRYSQYFSKRKAKSTWSKVNKDKVAILIAQKLMFPAGIKCIDTAKQNGSWTFLDSIDALIIPEDLEKALHANPNAYQFYDALSNSAKKILLYWVKSAKRSETRAKRIQEIAKNASQGLKPKAFR